MRLKANIIIILIPECTLEILKMLNKRKDSYWNNRLYKKQENWD